MVWLWLWACHRDEPTPAATGDTGTLPTVAPEIAVVDVDVVPLGPDVQLTFRTRTAVTRTLDAELRWPSRTQAIVVPILAGEGVVTSSVDAPCATFGVEVALEVEADGRTFAATVTPDGRVGSSPLAVQPMSLWAICSDGEPVTLDAQTGTYELRAVGGNLAGFGTNGDGLIAFGEKALVALDGRYTFTWSSPPYELVVWGQE